MFQHILVPVDGHPADATGAQHAFDLTRALGGRVTLLHILESDSPQGRAQATAHLARLARGARRPPARALLDVPDRDVQAAVALYARRHGADLIVLGLSGAGGLADDALGEVATALARANGVPVHLAASPDIPGVHTRWRRVVSGP